MKDRKKNRKFRLLHYKPARIKYEKIASKDGLCIKIMGISAAYFRDLPEEYLNGFPNFGKLFFSDNDVIVWWEKDNGELDQEILEVGKVYTKERFEEVVKQMKIAGERLTEIVKRINEEARRKGWCGEGEVVI